jgi:hypothetical protein
MSAVSEWRDQSDCTCNSGATTNSDEASPPGVCSGLLS